MDKEASTKSIYAYLLFILWPLLSFFIAFYEYRSTWAKNIVWLFVAFFGYTMVISHEGMDANRYRDQFIEAAQSNTSTVVTPDLYAEDNEYLDILAPFLNIIISKFTENYKFLFLVYGLIFGYFFSRNLWLLLDRIRYRLTIISSLILFLFFLVNPIWNINGFRFWTAAQIFVYGTLLFVLEGKKAGLLIASTALFVHFSFMLPLIVLFSYSFLGNRITLYFYFFVFSLFITELNLEFVRDNLGFLPTKYEHRIESYTSEEYVIKIKSRTEELVWYAKYKNMALKYSIYALLIALYWVGKPLIKSKKPIYVLLSFTLLFYGMANIVSLIPSGGRFISIASALSLAVIFLYTQNYFDKRIDLILKLSIPALLLYIIVSIRMGFYTVGLTTILGNPLIALFMENDIALDQLIK